MSKIRTGDELVLRYDPDTTRMQPVGSEYSRALVNLLAKKLGTTVAAERCGVAVSTFSNWLHGMREPKGEYKQKLEVVAKEEGLAPRITDL